MCNYEILDQFDFMVYISDVETHDLVYINAFGRKLFQVGEQQPSYGKCYKLLQGLDEVCPFCNNEELLKESQQTWRHENQTLGNHYLIKDHLIERDGRKMRLECAIDISEIETEALKTRLFLEAERSLVSCIQKLSSCENLEASIEQVLRTILDYYKGDRGYIFEFDWETDLTDNTFEQCAPGIEAEIDNLQRMPIDIVRVWVNAFETQKYIHIMDVDRLKNHPTRHLEYETLAPQGIKSLLAVPFYCEGKLVGFLGVDNPKEHHDDMQFLLHLTYFICNEMEKRRMNQRLTYLSYCDQLTQVNNRNCFYAFLEDEGAGILENIGVVYIDLNGLKVINDTYGHTHGDYAIKTTANLIKKYVDEKEIYRISGDEFVVLLRGYTHSAFKEKVEELKQEIMLPGEELAAMGALWDGQVFDLKQMINRAEQIMYINKQKYYERTRHSQTKFRPRLLDSLIQAIEEDAFLIYLQPKQYLDTNEVYGAEALIRRIDKDGRIIMPYEFITLLEREKLIAKIDYFVLEQVCENLRRWHDEGLRNLRISVNISRVTLSESDFVKTVCATCDRYAIPYSQIQLEITESAETIDDNHLEELIAVLAQYGFSIAIDDMGIKYSSLEMLSLGGFDTIKLDGSLMRRIEQEKKVQILIRHIIHLCYDLGHSCVAEGVETETQRNILKEMGCDSIQGYLLDRPIPVNVFEEKYLYGEGREL